MNEKEQRLSTLKNEYSELCEKINKLNDFINCIDFEELVPDQKEQDLVFNQFMNMCSYRANLKARIRLLRQQIKNDNTIKDWAEFKPTDSAYIGVDVSADDDQRSIKNWDEFVNNSYKNYCRRALEKFLNKEITWAEYIDKMRLPFCRENLVELVNAYNKPDECNHCNQDGSVCCGTATASLKDLIDMQVVRIGHGKCESCPNDHYGVSCVKLELVGGAYLCLAPLPNSIVTE